MYECMHGSDAEARGEARFMIIWCTFQITDTLISELPRTWVVGTPRNTLGMHGLNAEQHAPARLEI